MSLRAHNASHADDCVDPRLEELMRLAVAAGVVLLLLLPAARASHAAIGWLPLWLLGMPLTAWWALHRFQLPTRTEVRPVARSRRRRTSGQARRRVPATVMDLPRAA